MFQNTQSESTPFYCLELNDFATPSFCSFGKKYFGTLPLITSLIDALEADEHFFSGYTELINAFQEYIAGNTEVKHSVSRSEMELSGLQKSLE